MTRMDDARGAGLTPPEHYFRKAQEKIAAGDYIFQLTKAKVDT